MSGTRTNPLIERLRRLTPLTAAELTIVDGLCGRIRTVPADRMIAYEGAVPDNVHVLLDGWAARQKLRRDGGRQFAAFLVPGDICDIDALHVAKYDYGVVTLVPCQIAVVDRSDLLDVLQQQPGIARALTWLAFVDNAMLTTWLTMVGRAGARERVAHLVCELKARLEVVRLAEEDGFILPITQEEIGDATGLTAVHVNRMLRALRDDGLMDIDDGRRLTIADERQLQRLCAFTPGYLHVEGMRA